VGLVDLGIASLENSEILTGPDAKAENSWESRDGIVAKPFLDIDIENGQARCELPPLSFVAMTLNL